jgi:hypothetical protein
MYVLVGMVAGVAIGISIVAARAEETPEPDDETIAAATEANVDPVALLGAMASTGLPARTYLYATGELIPPGPPLFGSLGRVDCIIGKESGGLDIPNRQGSGATGPGQYFPSSWARHSSLYRAATGYLGPLSLHILAHVRAVMSYVLTVYPSMRSEWSVGGC